MHTESKTFYSFLDEKIEPTAFGVFIKNVLSSITTEDYVVMLLDSRVAVYVPWGKYTIN